jgi:hypothetical protein
MKANNNTPKEKKKMAKSANDSFGPTESECEEDAWSPNVNAHFKQ